MSDMPRDGDMGTITADSTCSELAQALLVTTVHIGFEVVHNPLRGVSGSEFLGLRTQ
jgi:hypothetical protein